MSDRRFNLTSAHQAAERDQTARWVGDFLSSRGSDNEILAAALAQQELWWVGPVSLPVEDLVRLAGPEDDALVPIDDDEWEDDISSMEESVDDGWEPPPLLAEFQDDRLLLQDGNHRYEALVRAGAPTAWVLVYFGDPEQRDAFARARPEVAST